MKDEKNRAVYDESGDVTLRSYKGDAEEKRGSDLLTWRPRLRTISAVYWDGGIPKDVYEARMNLLEPEDRAILERAFSVKGDGRLLKYRFFGSDEDKNGDMDWRPTATGCARVTMDADSAMRIFKASAAFDGERVRDGQYVLNAEGMPVPYDAGVKYKAWISEYIRYASLNKEVTGEREASGAKLTLTEKLNRRAVDAFMEK